MIKFLLPNVTKIIKILIKSFKKNKEKVSKLINNKNIEDEATKLPNNSRLSFTTFFKTFAVAYNNIKSKKKFKKNTKSK